MADIFRVGDSGKRGGFYDDDDAYPHIRRVISSLLVVEL